MTGLSLFLLVSLASAQEDDPVAALAEVIPGEPGENCLHIKVECLYIECCCYFVVELEIK